MQEFTDKIAVAVKDIYGIDVNVELTVPDESFGDYSTNIAMQLAPKLGKNPREIAGQIKDALNNDAAISGVEIAGPGFINIFLNNNYLISIVNTTVPKKLNNKVVVVEYSCPNAFKELHAGHLYQTIAGDALSRLLEKSGAKVGRTNFGGDVGLHVAKAMYGIISKLGGEKPEMLESIQKDQRAQFLSAAYVLGASVYEKNGAEKTVIEEYNQKIYKLHDSEDTTSGFAQIYWICRQWSYDYFDQFYETIEVNPFKYYPESVCTPPGLELVDRGLNEGLFDKSEGAVVYSEAKSGLHTRVFVTSGGLPTYETKDLGVIKLELDDFNFDHRILITGRDQTEYMKVVYSAAGELMPQTKGNMTHLSNGIIKFGDGKKMSSRLGNVTTALDVIDNVKSIVEKTSSKEADTIMLGAVKYEFLKHKLGGDISFDPQESVSLQGNSGPYLQYAHARARSILEKVTNKNFEITNNIELNLHERLLARKLAQYQNVLSQAIDSYEVHIICTYLYELSQVFNRFYENNKVVGDEREPIRAFLVEQYADTLKNGLEILGIKAPNKM
jgi:arginyl-tRNA synthetase